MSYYRRSYSRPETVNTPAAKAMLDQMAKVQNLTDWERKFVDSLAQSWVKYDSMTVSQYQTLQKLSSRYDEDAIARREAWNTSWSDANREIFTVMSHYYQANPPYFQDLANRCLEDTDYIPTEKAYRAMCENKYAQKVLDVDRADPQYPAGSMAVVRDSGNVPPVLRFIKGRTVIVIEHPEGVYNAANGAKRVKILPVGETQAFDTEERWLKKLPKKLR